MYSLCVYLYSTLRGKFLYKHGHVLLDPYRYEFTSDWRLPIMGVTQHHCIMEKYTNIKGGLFYHFVMIELLCHIFTEVYLFI